jgi:diacylglycerol O-acyltransferase / wax synthase
MGTLDEKYLAPPIYRLMVNHAVLLFGSKDLRRTDGSIDLDAIKARIERLTWRVPPMRQSLVRTPLRLTTPAWVPVAHLDIGAHVHLHPTVEPDDPFRPARLVGTGLPPLEMTRPLWDVHVIGLESGRVALLVRIHHAMGDGLLMAEAMTALTSTEPQGELPEVSGAARDALGTAPRNGLETLRVAGGRWWEKHAPFATAWHEYWRKPFRRRLRRWALRILAPLVRLAPETDHPAPYAAYFQVALEDLRNRAQELGGSPNDLIAAATLHAAAQEHPNEGRVSLLVPFVLRREASARNHVGAVEVELSRGESLADTVASVHRGVRAAFRGDAAPPTGSSLGYATYLPRSPVPVYFGTARVESVIGWPTVDPKARLACLTTAYADQAVVAVRVRDPERLPSVLRYLEATLVPSRSGGSSVAMGESYR